MVRLGILLEHGTAADSIIRLAVVAERAGLDGLWLTSQPGSLAPEDPSELLAALVAAAERTTIIVLGADLSRLPDAGTIPNRVAERLEAVLPARPTSNNGWKGRITVRTETQGPPYADGVVVPIWAFGPEIQSPTVPVSIELAASIGRTTAEAMARLIADGRLRDRRDPRRGGLFGTLEQCQARVAELATAGVAEVRCWLPNTPDVHDVIGQLSAVAVAGPTPQGRHARPPSPPSGWGGRSRGHEP